MENQKMIEFGVFRQPQQLCSIWEMTLCTYESSSNGCLSDCLFPVEMELKMPL